jgi:hypothetical protein
MLIARTLLTVNWKWDGERFTFYWGEKAGMRVSIKSIGAQRRRYNTRNPVLAR